jgi:hypothetical protein
MATLPTTRMTAMYIEKFETALPYDTAESRKLKLHTSYRLHKPNNDITKKK